MQLKDLTVRWDRAPQVGLALFNEDTYIGHYQTLQECVMDLVYHFSVAELQDICEQFRFCDRIRPPYKYRGICSEFTYITDNINSYIHYGDTLGEVLAEFEKHEQRALRYPKHFMYGAQGCGIHLFNEQTGKYEFWLGGQVKSVSDIIRQAKAENKLIPDALVQELAQIDRVDVFISHKSEDVRIAKAVYDLLTEHGYCAFLSEISLPAVSNADYVAEIDSALDKAQNLVVIADSAEKVESGWVKYEWSSFSNEKRSGRKRGNLITVVTENISIDELPFALRQSEVVPVSHMAELLPFIV